MLRVVVLFLLAFTVQAVSESPIATFLHNLPRTAYGQDVNNTFQPENPYYFEAIAFWISPFVLFGLFMFLGLFLYCCVALCSCRRRKKMVSECSWFCCRFTGLLLFALLCIAASVGGLIINWEFHDDVGSFVNVIVEAGQEVAQNSSAIYSTLQQLGDTSVVPGLQQFVAEANVASAQAKNLSNVIFMVEADRNWGTIGLYGIGILVGLLSMFAFFFPKTPLFHFISFLAFVFGSICLFTTAGEMAVAIVAADLCPDIDVLVNQTVPRNYYSEFEFFVNCTGNETLAQLDTWFAQELQTLETQLQAAKAANNQNLVAQLEAEIALVNEGLTDTQQLIDCRVTRSAYDRSTNLLCFHFVNELALMSALQVALTLCYIVLVCSGVCLRHRTTALTVDPSEVPLLAREPEPEPDKDSIPTFNEPLYPVARSVNDYGSARASTSNRYPSLRATDPEYKPLITGASY